MKMNLPGLPGAGSTRVLCAPNVWAASISEYPTHGSPSSVQFPVTFLRPEVVSISHMHINLNT